MTDETPIRVLIAKPGLDGHDRGAKVLARGLRDEGFEVIYTGLRQTPEMIADAAEQEDVDVVGLSILSGAHMALLPRTVELLRERGMSDVLVAAGGIIPDADIAQAQAGGDRRDLRPGHLDRPDRALLPRERQALMRPRAYIRDIRDRPMVDDAGHGRSPSARQAADADRGRRPIGP